MCFKHSEANILK